MQNEAQVRAPLCVFVWRLRVNVTGLWALSCRGEINDPNCIRHHTPSSSSTTPSGGDEEKMQSYQVLVQTKGRQSR
ncbi:hypothetical protein BgiBS90_016028 [Biomphalaria glabrata]|nr:hypothetical protein BgiBS90_016028 [Biomphalaria glabrata]